MEVIKQAHAYRIMLAGCFVFAKTRYLLVKNVF